MKNNNMSHISDKAASVTFDPTGTDWASTITDVQTALSKVAGWANKDTGLPLASRTVAGIIRTCSLDEVKVGTEDGKAVTPKVLKEYFLKPYATTTEYGTVRYANLDELKDITKSDVVVSPQGVAYMWKELPATEDRVGGLKIATTDQAKQGTQDDRIMTPKKVKQAIDALVPKVGIATETSQGVVQLATSAQIAQGTAGDGFAISPKGFANARGTSSAYGTFKAADDNDMSTLSAQDKAVTPYILGRNKAATNKFGVVKLVTDISSEGNTALAGNANVMSKQGGVFSGNIYKGSTDDGNRFITVNEAFDAMPIGSIIMWPGHNLPSGRWTLCDGKWLNKATYSALHNVIGTMYGGDANSFAVPDIRGQFPRGCDNGRGIDGGRGLGTNQRGMTETHQHIGGGLGEAYGHGGFKSYFGNTRSTYAGSKGNIDWDNVIYYTNDGSDWDGNRINTDGRIGHETRPTNIALHFIIKIS